MARMRAGAKVLNQTTESAEQQGVPEPDTIQIVVDTDVRLRCDQVPRKLVEALRRQLRQHDSDRTTARQPLFRLLQTIQGHYCLPQGLLSRVTESCRRQDLPFAVQDRRRQSTSARSRCRLDLSPQHELAVRQLLLGAAGVLICGDVRDRLAVAAELIARRQQRTLYVTTSDNQSAVAAQLRDALGLQDVDVAAWADSDAHARVVTCTFDEAAGPVRTSTRADFGLTVFDAPTSVDALLLMRAIRRADSRYLLGLTDERARPDGLHGLIHLALGGLTHQMAAHTEPRALKLFCRRQPTEFAAPYEGRSQYQALLASLAANEQRNALIAEDVTREVAQGKPCLVLSERRDHLDRLKEALPATAAAGAEVITSAVRPAERNAIVARFDRGEIDVLLATGQIATDSLAIARASRLFIAFPFSYTRKLERVVKILMQPATGKDDVVVYDYDDIRLVPLHRACDKRARILARLRRAAERDRARWAQMDLDLG